MDPICDNIKNVESSVETALKTAPEAERPAAINTVILRPLVSKSQQYGKTNITKVIVPQLAIMATVESDQL